MTAEEILDHLGVLEKTKSALRIIIELERKGTAIPAHLAVRHDVRMLVFERDPDFAPEFTAGVKAAEEGKPYDGTKPLLWRDGWRRHFEKKLGAIRRRR